MGSFANHSKTPNAKKVRVIEAIALEALRVIESGEEITIDYGPMGSESYTIAMGAGRYVVATRPDGTYDVSFVPMHADGDVVKVSATREDTALTKLAGDLCAELVSPSAISNGCFLRGVAILLTDLLRNSPRGELLDQPAAEAFRFLRA